MSIQHLSVSESLASLHSSLQGLSRAQVEQRRPEFGLNIIESQKRDNLFKRLFAELTHFFALILWFAALLCFIAEHAQPGEGMASLGFAVLGVIVINAAFSFWQEQKAERALDALEQLLPRQCKALRDGLWSAIPIADLVPGDIIQVEEGDDIAADARVLESHNLRVNTATITGESRPGSRNAEPSSTVEMIHATNILLAGTHVVTGRGLALVFATGSRSEFGRIAHMTLSSKKSLSPLEIEINRVSRMIAMAATALGFLFFVIGKSVGLSLWQSFLFGIGILVANVPEGLLPTVTLALALGAQRMAKRQVLVRHLPAVETLGSTTVICTDKTGTLTRNEMSVKKIDLLGVVFEAKTWQEQTTLGAGQRDLLAAMRDTHALSGSPLNPQDMKGDPLELALVQFAWPWQDQLEVRQRKDELGFDADRRRQSVLLSAKDHYVLVMKGAPEVVIHLCSSLQGQAQPEPMNADQKKILLERASALAQQGLRVIAFAQKTGLSSEGGALDESQEKQLHFLGFVGLEDPLRPEVQPALETCKKAGIRVIMITGDHPQTARVLAQQAGIFTREDARVVTGVELETWSHTQLQLALNTPEIAFARVRADQKMKIVLALKDKNEVVAVTGDGVNDAPALKKADIGIAMGRSGTDVARESADMILLDDNFASIVAAIEEGRTVFANVRKFLTYILSSNVPEAVPYLGFVLFQIPLPLTVIQILAIDLGTDMLPALGLGAEKPDPSIMLQPPRKRQERLLDGSLIKRAYLWLGLWEAFAAMAAFFFVLSLGGWHWGEPLANHSLLYKQATTATFAAIVLMQVVNVFLCRRNGFFGSKHVWTFNRLIVIGVAIELLFLFAIVYIPPMQNLLQTASLPSAYWPFILAFMLAMYGAELLRIRWIQRSSNN